jgi:hypothetical protein
MDDHFPQRESEEELEWPGSQFGVNILSRAIALVSPAFSPSTLPAAL